MSTATDRYDHMHDILDAAVAEMTTVIAADLLGGISAEEMARQHELLRKRIGKLYGEAKRHADACAEAARQVRSAGTTPGMSQGGGHVNMPGLYGEAKVLQFRR